MPYRVLFGLRYLFGHRLLFGHTVVFLACACVAAEPGSTSSIDLTARYEAGNSNQVEVQYEAGGDLLMGAQDGEQKVPMSVVAELSYRERWLEPWESTADPTPPQTIRHYDAARATIKIGQGGLQSELPTDKRVIRVAASEDASLLVSPAAPLTREELDLIDIPAGTHVLDRLMPGGSKSIGDKWEHTPETMEALLGVKEITICEVESVLIGIEKGYAQVRLAGTVHGKTDGSATELEVKAGYLFDARTQRITRLNLAFAEQRKEGPIGPAVDVVGKLAIKIDPMPQSEGLTDAEASPPSPAELDGLALLVLEGEPDGLRLLHDRLWHVTSHERERIILRRLDEGQFTAQCNLTIRPERQAGRQPTLAEFEKDVRFSLGKRLDTIVTSGEWTNTAGMRCRRIVAQGKVDDLPMEWRYYLASPPAGRSIAFAFSVEPRFAEQLEDADQALVESVRWTTADERDRVATEGTAAAPRNGSLN